VIKFVGRYFITRLEHNPGYASFTAAAGAVGLLLFMLFLHMIVLFAAALAATSGRGAVYDMACRPVARIDAGDDDDAAQSSLPTRLGKD
jgi:membrane protein